MGAGRGARASAVDRVCGHRFEPAAAGSQWLTLDSLDLRGHLRTGAALSADLALRPVVIYDRSGNAVAPLVNRQAMLHADAGDGALGPPAPRSELPLVVWQRGMGGERPADIHATNGRGPGRTSASDGGSTLRRDGHRVTIAAGAPAVFSHRAPERVHERRRSARLATPRRRGTLGSAGVGGEPRLPHPPYLQVLVRADARERDDRRRGRGVRGRTALARGARALRQHGGNQRPLCHRRGQSGRALARRSLRRSPEWEVGVGAAPGLTNGAGSPSWRFVTTVQYWPLAAAPKSVNVSEFPKRSSSGAADPRSTL